MIAERRPDSAPTSAGPAPAGVFSETFSPLRNRNLSTYLAGQVISLSGTFMQATAQSWVVWQLSHSVRDLGLVAMLEGLPLLLFGAFAGALADRMDRRKLLIATQTGAMLLAFVFAILLQRQLIQLWHVFLLAFALGCVSALDMPAQSAFIGDLSGMERVRQAVVLNTMVQQGSRTIGPTVAGFVVGTLGIAPAFWINGASFLAVIGSLLVVRAHQVRKPAGDRGGGFGEAVRYVGSQPLIRDLLLMSGFLTFFLFTVAQLVPAIATGQLAGGPEALGLLLGATGAGALASTVGVVPVTLKVKKVGWLLGATIAWAGIWVAVVSVSTWMWISVTAAFLSSLAVPVVMSFSNGLIQTMAPADMRGRLLVLWIMVTFGLQPIAALLIGYLGQFLGAPGAVLFNGSALIVGSATLLVMHPALRGWELTRQGTRNRGARQRDDADQP